MQISKYEIPKTLAHTIYNQIKELIVNNEIRANQKINEKEMAKTFGVSQTPVREAIIRLEAEGYIVSRSRKEVYAKDVSFKDIKEISEVLSLLDGYAISLSVDVMRQEDLDEIETLTKKMERYCHPDLAGDYMRANTDVHNKIWECIPNNHLKESLKASNSQRLRYHSAIVFAFGRPGAIEKSLSEHKEILSALKARDRVKLKRLMREHWLSLLKPAFKPDLMGFLRTINEAAVKEFEIIKQAPPTI